MAKYLFVILAMTVKLSIAQRIIPQNCQAQYITEQVVQQIPNLPVAPTAVSEYSIELCKNLANAVQNMVLNKFAASAYKKPVFNQIAGPLVNEIALKAQGCSCPCGNVGSVALTGSYGNPVNVIQDRGIVAAQYNNLPAIANVRSQVVTNQNTVAPNPIQQKYSNVLSLVESLRGNNCGCLKNVVGLY